MDSNMDSSLLEIKRFWLNMIALFMSPQNVYKKDLNFISGIEMVCDLGNGIIKSLLER